MSAFTYAIFPIESASGSSCLSNYQHTSSAIDKELFTGSSEHDAIVTNPKLAVIGLQTAA
jgi:hypothetical protein